MLKLFIKESIKLIKKVSLLKYMKENKSQCTNK